MSNYPAPLPSEARQNNTNNNNNNAARPRHVEIVQQVAERISHSVSQVIVGKRNEVRLTVLGLLSQGHILIEDIPGVGKTMMAKALARSIGCSFSRLQFTPDMLPSDVTGVSLFNQKTANLSSALARSWRKSSWLTKSTAPRPRRKPLCSKRWKNDRSRS